MDQTPAWAFLVSIWSGIDPNDLQCSHCGERIQPQDVLARTFSLESWHRVRPTTAGERWAEKIPIPLFDDDAMLIYHRHLACLLQSTQYVAISHVWHAQVADLQYRKLQATSSVDEVERIVREVPARIARGLAAGLGDLQGRFEIWHDYISVPQWTPVLKSQIILAIPEIFGRAATTLAYLSDVNPGCIRSMREGRSMHEVSRGVTDLCNSTWFSRIWTAMEFTQSRGLRAMLQDFELMAEDVEHAMFLEEMWERWGKLVRVHGNNAVEETAAMGDNLVPWQLGPLRGTRAQTLAGVTMGFAPAYQLLCRRRVTVPRDFLHAILGILKPDITEPQLSGDIREALRQIAIVCLKRGDFSPLFMIPASALTEASPATMRSLGFLDLGTFALDNDRGTHDCPPQFSEVKFLSPTDNPIIRAECLGTIRVIRRVQRKTESYNGTKTFATLSRLAIDTCGLDAEEFATTMGVRLYGQERHRIFKRLSERGRMDLLREKLGAFWDTYPDSLDAENVAAEIADVIGLSDNAALGGWYHGSSFSALGYMGAHGSSMHLTEAQAVIGVVCLICQQTFLIRAALLEAPSRLMGLKAYRVPGLRYNFTLPGGCGCFLNQDGCIVGRFIWGSPTCSCPKLQDVEVTLEAPPEPKSNDFSYGKMAEPKYWQANQEGRVRWLVEKQQQNAEDT